MTTRSFHVLWSFLFSALLVLKTTFSSNQPIDVSPQSKIIEGNGDNHDHDLGDQSIIQCGIYLAPSSIPGSGLGMYVGNRTIYENEIVTDEDIVIPIFEREWHSNVKGKFLWDEYIWNAPVFPGMEEELENGETDEISVASPGVGSAANSYMSLVNVEDNYIRIDVANIGPESPGRGAFTIYHGRSFYATDPIEPGQEIFVSYGNQYFKSRKRIYGYIPLPDEDYDNADKLLDKALLMTLENDKIDNNKTSNHISPQSVSESVRREIWNDLHSLIIEISKTYKSESRILNAIPKDPSLAEIVLDNGGTAFQDFNRSIKDLKWLEENGQCMDNIKTGISLINHAGRGAFARRFIPNGGLVAPAPLIHIKDMEMIRTYFDLKRNRKGYFVPDRNGRSSYQLLLNYCFAHEESTLLLCPYGLLTSLINHSHDQPNTKIQWAKQMRHKEWMEQPIHKWGDEYHTGLQLDFVAIRDIAAGEEILIDYGATWQEAWDEHAETFVTPEPSSYIPAFGLNEILYALEMRTENDREYELDNVRMLCRWHYLTQRGVRKTKGSEDPACRIVRKLGHDSYLVRLVEWSTTEDDKSKYNAGKLVWGLPKDGFYFEDLPLTRDHHQIWAFRHPMMIPNEMFPEIWRNVDNAQEFAEYEDEEDKDEM